MKTVKTVNGFKKIEDSNPSLVPMQLRSILQEHRATLVDKLLQGGLENYIDYKFSTKVSPQQVEQLKTSLLSLRQDNIDMEIYSSIFEAVQQNDFTSLNGALFYLEIDEIIKETLSQPKLFAESKRTFYY